MKKLLFGLIATVIFGGLSFSQDFGPVGNEHNRLLKIIYQNLDASYTRDNAIQKAIAVLQKQNTSLRSVYVFSNYSTPEIMVNELLLKGKISKDLFSKVILDLKNLILINNYKELVTYIDTAVLNSKTLPYIDLPKYLDFLSAAKASAYLWEPTAGNGPVIFIPGPVLTTHVASKVSVKAGMIHDAIGCLAGPEGGAVASLIYLFDNW